MLPECCKPILITDAGFRGPWFRAVEAMGYRVLLPAGPGNLPMAFVAFSNLDIPALDQLSRRLHEPVDSAAFTSLHAV